MHSSNRNIAFLSRALVLIVSGALCRAANLPARPPGHREGAGGPPRPEMTVPACKAPPVIDGELNDPCWKQANSVTGFYLYKGKGKTSDKQTVRMTHDDEWLYFAYEIELPHPDAIQITTTEHDGNVSRDNSVEVFTDAGTGGETYLHYMLSVGNARAERMIFMQGKSKETTWNMPWRSATKMTKTGWQAEMALPLAVLAEKGSLDKLTMNIGVNRILPTLNYMNVLMATKREISSWAPVKKSFHEPWNFGIVKGLEKVKPKTPFLAAARSIRTSSYKIDEQGRFFYEVSGAVDRFTDTKGKILVVVEDKPGAGKGETAQEEVALADSKEAEFSVKVPVKILSDRTAELTLRDPKTGEILQAAPLRDMSGLCLMRSYARYSYYTTEREAEVVCEIGLPEQELKKVSLVTKDADGKVLAVAKELKTRTMLSVPIRKLEPGSHTLKIELQRENGDTAVSQEVTLVKRKPLRGCEWKIDHGNKCILNNGKPFFPFGIMAKTSKDYEGIMAKDIASMGFNTVIRWGRTERDDIEGLLDMGKKYGLKVVDFPRSYWKYTPPEDQAPKGQLTPDESWEWVMTNVWLHGVARLMKHPNLMGWYLWDEPQGNLVAAARILDLHNRIYELDGYHPTEVLYIPPVPEGEIFARNCDIFGLDPYWVPGGGPGGIGNPNGVGRVTWLARKRAARDLKLAWITPCAERWSGTRMRIFNKNEQRVQTYLSLINGANALLYFVYPFKHRVTYEAFKELGKDMKVLGPACAAGDVPQIVKYTPKPFDPMNNIFPDIQVSLKRHPRGGYILMAANWKPYPVDAHYKVSLLGKSGSVKPLFKRGNKCKVKDSGFSDRLAPMDTRAYVIKGSRELSEPVEIAVNVKGYPKKSDPFYTKVAIPDTGAPGKKNILRNSSFEECSFPGMADYYIDLRTAKTGMGYRHGDERGDCGWGVVTDNPYHGKNCLRLQGRFLLFGVTPKTEKPEKFVFSAWVRGDGSPNQRMAFYGPVDKKKHFTLTKDWQRISRTATLSPDVPRGGYLFGFTVYQKHGASSTNTVWIDAMQFEKGTEVTEYE